ncbi:surface-adhesin E family protein [Zophobihabitans entericus]|uniref:Surface-adhesin protein E-like domain-containing protein n=1 Tax=Zophobihabitans entericus TaxID=1635327 RepID=A0A6G9IEC7_9GAMM|nr:surface-adhesin E family protein [Zophobihabitans entericus]QIQ21940.1 hypothetical protein IPMB12_09765 [Zophobihabitans entericus]
MNKLSFLPLLLLSFGAVSSNVSSVTTSPVLNDPRVPSLFLPMQKSTFGESTTYTYIDRSSVQLHQYNTRIRQFSEIVNYVPGQEIISNNKTQSYQSLVTAYYVNCNKMELGKGTIHAYQDLFGEGQLLYTNDAPKRWEVLDKNTPRYNFFKIACDLPLNNKK